MSEHSEGLQQPTSLPDSEPKDEKDREGFRYVKAALARIHEADPSLYLEILIMSTNLQKKYGEDELRKYWLWYPIIGGTYTNKINGVAYNVSPPIYFDFEGEDSVVKKIVELEARITKP